MQINRNSSACLILFVYLTIILTSYSVIIISNEAFAVEQFSIKSKINLQNIDDPVNLKVIASANGVTKAKKTGVIEGEKSAIVTIPFDFKTKNDLVTAGYNDEYFVCGYVLDAKTDLMKSYACYEGDLQNSKGDNTVTLNSFQPVDTGENSKAKQVKIKVLVPLYDRKHMHDIKVVAMVKGEFQSKIINAEGANGKTISSMLIFDRNTDIGKIEKGDMYFACVSANELNPPEGTECEHKHIKSLDDPNILAAR